MQSYPLFQQRKASVALHWKHVQCPTDVTVFALPASDVGIKCHLIFKSVSELRRFLDLEPYGRDLGIRTVAKSFNAFFLDTGRNGFHAARCVFQELWYSFAMEHHSSGNEAYVTYHGNLGKSNLRDDGMHICRA